MNNNIMKKATTVEEQIVLLESRGMIIDDKEKAKEILLDIGYYRLGFYWFHFEKTYPSIKNRNHILKSNTKFCDVISLYYFDCTLRNILSKYLNRIEVNFRTFIIYTVSNQYQNTRWFAEKQIIDSKFLNYLPNCYNSIRKNMAIKRHHNKYPDDIYAPAWKTLEYMTLGDIIMLYWSLKDNLLKEEISKHYNITNINVFYNYLNTIRTVRNLCAHGHNIYDLNLQKSLQIGPIVNISNERRHNIVGCLLVISYFLKEISYNRDKELRNEITKLLSEVQSKSFYPILEYIGEFLHPY